MDDLDASKGGRDVGGTELATDAMTFVAALSPFWLIFGGVAFADLVISFLVKLFKQGRVKW